MTPAPSPWWSPQRHADRRPALVARARALTALRAWLDAAGFLEVDPGAVVSSPGAEVHLQAFTVRAEGAAAYLHTSPEFAMKRLIAAGESRIYALAKAYRAGERGPLHAPEFMLLEWYRAHADWRQVANDSLALIQTIAQSVGAASFVRQGRACDPAAPAQWLTVEEAFNRHADVALLETISAQGQADREALAREARRIGLRFNDSDDWSDLFSRILVERVEPNLGWLSPCVLHDYPIPEAALARRSSHDPRVAERFELYACGVELANGFGELTDAAEQRRRFVEAMAEKQRRYGVRWPIDEDFLAAVAELPPCSGCAMGFDRVVMLAAAAPAIADVIWTPHP